MKRFRSISIEVRYYRLIRAKKIVVHRTIANLGRIEVVRMKQWVALIHLSVNLRACLGVVKSDFCIVFVVIDSDIIPMAVSALI